MVPPDGQVSEVGLPTMNRLPPTAEPATAPGLSSCSQTRARLLEAAAQEFAEHGYRKATVRNICDAAGANVAAVNYHFGDKQQLYAATLNHGVALSMRQYPPDMGLGPKAMPQERLHAYVLSFLHRCLGCGAPAAHGKMMAREMIEPTEAMDALVAETMRPLAEYLHGIVRDLIGPDAPGETVRRCALSIVGQCCIYRHAQEMLARMHPDMTHTAADLDRLADHITQFSLSGLAGCACAGAKSGEVGGGDVGMWKKKQNG